MFIYNKLFQSQVKFAALVEHPACVSATTTSSSPAVQPRLTRFLALDKCLPNRDFLQVTVCFLITWIYCLGFELTLSIAVLVSHMNMKTDDRIA